MSAGLSRREGLAGHAREVCGPIALGRLSDDGPPLERGGTHVTRGEIIRAVTARTCVFLLAVSGSRFQSPSAGCELITRPRSGVEELRPMPHEGHEVGLPGKETCHESGTGDQASGCQGPKTSEEKEQSRL